MSGIVAVVCLLASSLLWAQSNRGYYRNPAIHGNKVVFVAEGDLWQVGVDGGLARRLTTNQGQESRPAFSPNGDTLAFTADYEGPQEVYTMPASGGLPRRRTFEGGTAAVAGWTPDGKVLYSTLSFAGLPDRQLATIDDTNRVELLPLSQAATGTYDRPGGALFFTRLPMQSSNTKRYKGGLAQSLWKFTPGREAVPLTADFPGTSRDPMWWKGRLYFLTDRDGSMNIWSMDENGRNLKQHTRHAGLDVLSPALHEGRIVFQRGADLFLFDLASGKERLLEIDLPSDFDHLRERWIKPLESEFAGHINWDGNKLILLSRGKVFVAPAKSGRLVEATAKKPARYRDAVAMPDNQTLLTLSTESGEVELWTLPMNGVGPAQRLSSDGSVLRWSADPSPDGKWISHQDKNGQLWVMDTATRRQKKIVTAEYGTNSGAMFSTRWSPDSRWIAYTKTAANQFNQIFLYNLESDQSVAATSTRFNSSDPVFSAEGDWLYFISDRNLKTNVRDPWGARAPDPFYDKTEKIYGLALKKKLRFPFAPADELQKVEAASPPAEGAKEPVSKPKAVRIEIEEDGLASRLEEVPSPPGNLTGLHTVGKRLCWLSVERGADGRGNLDCLEIGNQPGNKPETIAEGVASFEVSGDGKKILVRKQNEFFIADAATKDLKAPKALSDAKVELKDWTFSVIPQDEFKEMFLDAWRLHRDYFYDRNMHGINWRSVQDRYLPLVSRVRDRAELNDVLAQMIGELSALHSTVGGGDLRRGVDQVSIGALGAWLERDSGTGSYLVKHVYASDPDRPDRKSPLAKEDVREGDMIVAVDGRDTSSASAMGELLRNRAGRQALLRIQPKGEAVTRDVVVKPLSAQADLDLRYHEWEYTRRLAVENTSGGRFGYLHLRAMGANDMDAWMEQYYPVHDREGLVIDVRHNNGGNIDMWLLGKLLRKTWFFWQPRIGHPFPNMPYSFRGHMVALVDERTASDGEAFAEGFKRLGLGTVIGNRTWGGEVWLSSSNRLADRGVATAGELGVYGPEGKWLIEGHGVEPDQIVDNLPYATYNGSDAQLDAAIAYLEKKVKEKPVTVVPAPKYPNMSSPNALPPAKQ